MYEPIRTKSVHTVADQGDYPHRSREEELDIQLAGHLSALLAVTDELRALTPTPDLARAADRIAGQIARLRGAAPVRGVPEPAVPGPGRARSLGLHHRAHALAGRALVVAASRADTTVAILAAERMDVHAAPEDTAPPALAARRVAHHAPEDTGYRARRGERRRKLAAAR
ncbi:SCO4983 family protein [Streptomyces sp. NPDC002454]|uniref:SCO4983 family protein n=1 Tax=Streptomyces sp. NPDC002490 TaxID=3154416 RepID=UPI003332064D